MKNNLLDMEKQWSTSDNWKRFYFGIQNNKAQIRRKFILKSISVLKHKFLVILNKWRESRIYESISDNNYISKD